MRRGPLLSALVAVCSHTTAARSDRVAQYRVEPDGGASGRRMVEPNDTARMAVARLEGVGSEQPKEAKDPASFVGRESEDGTESLRNRGPPPRVYEHDADIPEECYDRGWWSRKFEKYPSLIPNKYRKCYSLRQRLPELQAYDSEPESTERPEREPRRKPKEDGRAAFWVLAAAFAFLGVVVLALAVPFFVQQPALGLESFPEHVQDVHAAYTAGDTGYVQRLAQEQHPYQQDLPNQFPEGYNMPVAVQPRQPGMHYPYQP